MFFAVMKGCQHPMLPRFKHCRSSYKWN